MANADHLEALQQGIRTWDRWRKDHPQIRPDLSRVELPGINLSGADLRFVKLNGADLNQADLQGADLRGAQLQQSNLSRANLTQAMLTRCHLQFADMIGVRLCRADLRKANLKKADLFGADLTGADLREAVLIGTKLSGTTITGARMHGTLRDDWEIDAITCEHLYWDPKGRQRTPLSRSFKKGEFQSIYNDWPDILTHFESKAALESQVQSLTLKIHTAAGSPVATPRDLAETILPYLHTVAELQSLINKYVDLPGPAVRIVSIVCAKTVQVDLEGVSRLLAFIQEDLADWRHDNKNHLAKLARNLNEVEVCKKEAQILAIKSRTVGNTFESKMLQTEAAKKQAEAKVLATRFKAMENDFYAELEARLEKKFSFKWISDRSLAEFKRRALPLLQYLAESKLVV